MRVRELLEVLPGLDPEAEVWLDFPDAYDGAGPAVRAEPGRLWKDVQGNIRFAAPDPYEAQSEFWTPAGACVILTGQP